MVKIIPQLQKKAFNFVKLGKWDLWGRYENKNGKSVLVETKVVSISEYSKFSKIKAWKPKGKAPLESAWQKRGYPYNHEEIITHDNNVGIIGGYGRLRILDIDDLELGKKMEEIMNTFTIQTGKGGKHFYFLSDYSTNHVLVNDLGELRGTNYQVVCPPSRHPNGNPYAVYIDKPIREISKKEIREILKPYLRESSPLQNKTLPTGKDTSRSGLEYRRVLALIREGKSKEQVFGEMEAYSKWTTAPEQYKEMTYNKAFDYLNSEEEETFEDFEVFTDADLIDYEPPEQEWLIENQIPKGEVGLLVGKRGHRKSFIAQLQAICLASKQNVFQDAVSEKFKILWIDEEMGKNEIAKRSKALKKGLGIERDKLDIKYISRTGLKLDKPESKKLKKLIKIILDFKPDLVVVDCLQRVVTFEVDKDNSQISELFTGVVRPLIKKVGSSWLFIHHLRKSPSGNYRPEDPLDEVRGGSELVNYCRFVLMSQEPKYQTKTNEGGVMVVFRVLKMSNAQMPEPKVISFTSEDGMIKVAYEGLPEDVLAGEIQCAKAIKDWLFQEQKTGEFKTSEVVSASEKIGFKKSMLSQGLKVLVKDGFLNKQKRGLYCVAEVVKQQSLDEPTDKEIEGIMKSK